MEWIRLLAAVYGRRILCALVLVASAQAAPLWGQSWLDTIPAPLAQHDIAPISAVLGNAPAVFANLGPGEETDDRCQCGAAGGVHLRRLRCLLQLFGRLAARGRRLDCTLGRHTRTGPERCRGQQPERQLLLRLRYETRVRNRIVSVRSGLLLPDGRFGGHQQPTGRFEPLRTPARGGPLKWYLEGFYEYDQLRNFPAARCPPARVSLRP